MITATEPEVIMGAEACFLWYARAHEELEGSAVSTIASYYRSDRFLAMAPFALQLQLAHRERQERRATAAATEAAAIDTLAAAAAATTAAAAQRRENNDILPSYARSIVATRHSALGSDGLLLVDLGAAPGSAGGGRSARRGFGASIRSALFNEAPEAWSATARAQPLHRRSLDAQPTGARAAVGCSPRVLHRAVHAVAPPRLPATQLQAQPQPQLRRARSSLPQREGMHSSVSAVQTPASGRADARRLKRDASNQPSQRGAAEHGSTKKKAEEEEANIGEAELALKASPHPPQCEQPQPLAVRMKRYNAGMRAVAP
ncbi:hypothetical protein T492DRAFT_1053910 [Pavlovales sp. CCMP2436]|nr:hypothetical protein T492DRAFT_1053910 [Pavlovales sp. CCMP2436]